jgi:hypothetical protein
LREALESRRESNFKSKKRCFRKIGFKQTEAKCKLSRRVTVGASRELQIIQKNQRRFDE